MVEGRDGTTLCEGLAHTRARDCAALGCKKLRDAAWLLLGAVAQEMWGREAGLDHWAGSLGSVKSAARATARTHLAVSRTRGGVAVCLVDVPPVEIKIGVFRKSRIGKLISLRFFGSDL
jgi:hypothetical protein